MEALKVSRQVDNWNDDRLDELARGMKDGFAKVDARFAKVDARFAKVEGEMKEGFAKVDARFERVEEEMKAGFAKADARLEKAVDRLDSRFDKLQNLIWGFGGTLVVSLIAGVITLIATHTA